MLRFLDKPGECPSPWKGLDGTCDRKGDECQLDNECEDTDKCCFNGCQKECTKVPSQKYGTSLFLVMLLLLLSKFHHCIFNLLLCLFGGEGHGYSLYFVACLKFLCCIGQQLGELKEIVIVIWSLIISFIGLCVCPGFANKAPPKGRTRKRKVAFHFHILLTGEKCPVPMDTTLIIDSSECTSRRDWIRLLNFLQNLVSFFDVSLSGGRVSLIQFSSQANVVLKFNSLTGILLRKSEVMRQISRMRCLGGSRRIDKALELTDKELMITESGLRNISMVSRIFQILAELVFA